MNGFVMESTKTQVAESRITNSKYVVHLYRSYNLTVGLKQAHWSTFFLGCEDHRNLYTNTPHKENSYRLLGQCVCPNPFLNAIYCSCNFSLWLIYGFHAISSPFISSPNFYTFSNLYFFSKLKLTYFLFFTFLQLLFYFVLSIFISSTLHLCYFNY